MSDKCWMCGIEVYKWNDIFILYEEKLYCVECYELYTGKDIKMNCLN
jgi:hypothetical protein